MAQRPRTISALMIRSACARPSLHQPRSSKADGPNSKLLNDVQEPGALQEPCAVQWEITNICLTYNWDLAAAQFDRLKSLGAITAPECRTLTLWEVEYKGSDTNELEKGMGKAAQQLKAFSEAGGQVPFGTDVGHIEQFNTSEEFRWMSRAGMSFQQILASLTTNPALRFGDSTHRGRIAKGMDGDRVMLQADPAQDATAFSKVRNTIRGGKVIYSQK